MTDDLRRRMRAGMSYRPRQQRSRPMIFNREPALIIGLVQAVIALVVSFGLDLTVEQIGATLAVTAAVLSVVTRQQVTPVHK